MTPDEYVSALLLEREGKQISGDPSLKDVDAELARLGVGPDTGDVETAVADPVETPEKPTRGRRK